MGLQHRGVCLRSMLAPIRCLQHELQARRARLYDLEDAAHGISAHGGGVVGTVVEEVSQGDVAGGDEGSWGQEKGLDFAGGRGVGKRGKRERERPLSCSMF